MDTENGKVIQSCKEACRKYRTPQHGDQKNCSLKVMRPAHMSVLEERKTLSAKAKTEVLTMNPDTMDRLQKDELRTAPSVAKPALGQHLIPAF